MKDAKTFCQLNKKEIRSIGLSATTLAEIRHARDVLHEWEKAHSDEPKMYDVFEQLYMMEDAARTIAAEREDGSHSRAAVEIAA